MGAMVPKFCSMSVSEDNLYQLTDEIAKDKKMKEHELNSRLDDLQKFVDGHELPTRMKQKYNQDVRNIRNQIIEQMENHCDRYDGPCYLKEFLQEYKIIVLVCIRSKFISQTHNMRKWIDFE
ncbi:hypothetical protein pb186bvf_003965 [Paramecium bursaria]